MEMEQDIVRIYCDGASRGNPGPSSIGIWAVKEKDGKEVEVFSLSESLGEGTNNQAEWISLVKALHTAKEKNLQRVQVFMDSELVVNQVRGIYKIRNPKLKNFALEVMNLKNFFQEFSISHIPREKNKKADFLANQALEPKRF